MSALEGGVRKLDVMSRSSCLDGGVGGNFLSLEGVELGEGVEIGGERVVMGGGDEGRGVKLAREMLKR